MKILKEIHVNNEGANEMWFELSKGYSYRVSHKQGTREGLIKTAEDMYKIRINMENKD
jgi:hypothetical protein